MIQEIRLHNIATYTKPVTMRPLKINFCYGSNGSGKTTLSNLLGDYETTSESEVTWERNNSLPVYVYNKRFVEDNFGESKKINGIFTLGKETKEDKEFIAQQQEEVKACEKQILTFSNSRDKLIIEKAKLDSDFEAACWVMQQTYGKNFANALEGYRGSKKNFRDKSLQEFPNMDEANPLDLKTIGGLYAVAFGEQQEEYPLNLLIDTPAIIASEGSPMLAKKISGSAETPIGKFIEFLQNSDWVKQGIGYAAKTDGKCPYCQQLLPDTLQQDIEGFFDEVYEKECAALRVFQGQYEAYMDALLAQMKKISTTPISILDYELFNAEVSVLTAAISEGKKTIKDKLASPATEANIDSVEPIALRINKIIEGFNVTIEKNNNIVRNQKKEQERCKKLLWQFFTYELRTIIRKYKTDCKDNAGGIKSLMDKIKEHEDKKEKHEMLKSEREEKLTSVVPTVNAINSILKRFGFDSFLIAENPTEKGTYIIIRPDGQDVGKTLSEGEYNFITFLYFYHLVYGSHEKIGISSDKVVVIDDPISSLDSNVLFIISTLVRGIVKDCYNGGKGIQQAFVLTHNVYFHKEVSYWGSRETPSPKLVAFWVVKKIGNVTDIINHPNNPIQTSYELLWSELQELDRTPRITIFNTLRRILEYYFNVIGGLNYDECIDSFGDEDKIICKALISCINDGSHFISDDFVMCYETDAMENYLRIFRLIFENMGHGSHYE